MIQGSIKANFGSATACKAAVTDGLASEASRLLSMLGNSKMIRVPMTTKIVSTINNIVRIQGTFENASIRPEDTRHPKEQENWKIPKKLLLNRVVISAIAEVFSVAEAPSARPAVPARYAHCPKYRFWVVQKNA